MGLGYATQEPTRTKQRNATCQSRSNSPATCSIPLERQTTFHPVASQRGECQLGCWAAATVSPTVFCNVDLQVVNSDQHPSGPRCLPTAAAVAFEHGRVFSAKCVQQC